MSVQELMRSHDEVAAALPFHVDDYEHANEAFMRWRAVGDPQARQIVELWVFCYTRRYFIAKFCGDSGFNPADFERPVGDAFRRVMERLDEVQDPDRFVNYVSVVCRSVYVNFRRRMGRSRRVHLPPEAIPEPVSPSADPFDEYDRLLLRQAIERAIERLPDSLRTIAQLRLLRGRSYEEIEDETGHSLPTLRSYFSKALQKLRDDEALRDVADAWRS
jgi:RNA polymerase sigma factor (sigma-70 family)